ncbi:MAG: polymerase [Hydrocarboniphaga sp.]|uniref:uracil-DNA glycosylase n=1 Tax=Hydrocarboniphaga sp. TaxID=2033016 RepID=UPI0026334377|nr:uracil-DNA glycosylase [Hydrocarboniphaga sp.]MDB5971449.1 polymerase [Hydrocarboniphaga sp.]
MESARRRQYLKALGIDTFVRRDAVGAEAEPLVEALAPQPAPGRTSRPDSSALAAAAATADEPREIMPRPRARPPASPQPAASITIASTPAVAITVDIPKDWAGLREMVRDCPRCKLCATRTQTVFGVGAENAPLLVVGEGPGADEDAQGEPFVGRAGQLLDQMLKAIGRSRTDNTYIANVVKCRPPGNRDPEADEVEACRPYLDRQIELIKPRLIVGLGRTAAQRLLHTDEPLSRLRGPLHEYGPTKTPVFITYHPAYLLRSPREKAKSWQDLKRIHQLLTEAG